MRADLAGRGVHAQGARSAIDAGLPDGFDLLPDGDLSASATGDTAAVRVHEGRGANGDGCIVVEGMEPTAQRQLRAVHRQGIAVAGTDVTDQVIDVRTLERVARIDLGGVNHRGHLRDVGECSDHGDRVIGGGARGHGGQAGGALVDEAVDVIRRVGIHLHGDGPQAADQSQVAFHIERQRVEDKGAG